MSQTAQNAAPTAAPLVLTAAILFVAGLGAFLFAANGTELFVAMIQSGIAWCF